MVCLFETAFYKVNKEIPYFCYSRGTIQILNLVSTGAGDSHVGDRIVSRLLTEMNRQEDLKGVIVIEATNLKKFRYNIQSCPDVIS